MPRPQQHPRHPRPLQLWAGGRHLPLPHPEVRPLHLRPRVLQVPLHLLEAVPRPRPLP